MAASGTAASGVVNVTEIIDQRGFKGYQIWIIMVAQKQGPLRSRRA